MKTICLTFVLLASMLTAEVFGATETRTFQNAVHPGKCYLNATLILNPGDVKTIPICEQFSCFENSVVVIQTCGPKFVSNGGSCKLGAKKYPNDDYPKCCINVLKCSNGDKEL